MERRKLKIMARVVMKMPIACEQFHREIRVVHSAISCRGDQSTRIRGLLSEKYLIIFHGLREGICCPLRRGSRL